MKRNISGLIAIVLVTIAMMGCKDQSDYDDTEYQDTAIVMKAVGTVEKVRIGLIGTREAVIDWGDGKTQNFTLNADGIVVEHTYSPVRDTADISVTGTNVTGLSCNSDRLISLDVTQSPHLVFLNCENNKISRLDVGKNPALEYLYCSDNQIMSLNLEKNPLLQLLLCRKNYLSALNLTQNTGLQTVNCESNYIGLTEMDAMIGSLHGNPPRNNQKEIWIERNAGSSGCNKVPAQGKGWMFMEASEE
ncbi:MAG: hypothetical protein LBD59_09575 [Prevotellaceae bacterium]|jgi:hypothetical protein|nr:hypothetical protein [Prevotellaceae bacterium]